MHSPLTTLFDSVVKSLLPEVYAGTRGRKDAGLCAHITATRNPVFANLTVTLTVQLPGEAEVLTAKNSISELVLMNVTEQQGAAMMLAESVKYVCALLAPRLYEYDPRRGTLVSVNRPELSPDLLFDPPGWSPPTFAPEVECAVCNRDFDPMTHEGFALWGGGNLGFIHVECSEGVGVSLAL
jgi:hypothetical protein